MSLRKLFAEQRGAVSLVEGAYIFPLVYMVIFFLLLLALIFWRQIYVFAGAYKALQKPTSSPAYGDPQGLLPGELKGENPRLKVHGIFFRDLEVREDQGFSGGRLFGFFDLPKERTYEKKVRVRWASSAENLRRYMAIMGLIKKKESGS